MRLGVNGLTDVDCDCKEAVIAAPFFLPRNMLIFGRASNPNSHWICRSKLVETERKAALQFKDPDGKMLVELRIGEGGSGAQTVGPGSTHEGTGEKIAWVSGRDGTLPTIDSELLINAVRNIAAAAFIARHWPKSGEHDMRLTLGGMLARSNRNISDARSFAEAVCRAANDPEVRETQRCVEDAFNSLKAGKPVWGLPKLRELIGKKSADKFAGWLGYSSSHQAETEDAGDLDSQPNAPAGEQFTNENASTNEEIIAKINRNFTVVRDGGNVIIMARSINPEGEGTQISWMPMKTESFRLLSRNRSVKFFRNGRWCTTSSGEYWERHPSRSQKSAVQYAPGLTLPPDQLNLWGGFTISPKPGDWSMMRDLVLNTICSGNTEHAEYLLNWMAQVVQKPWLKTKVAVVLKGGEGVGKPSSNPKIQTSSSLPFMLRDHKPPENRRGLHAHGVTSPSGGRRVAAENSGRKVYH